MDDKQKELATSLLSEEKNLIKEMTSKIINAEERELIEEALQNNTFEFKHNDNLYRISPMDYAHKQEISKARISKFTELMKQKDLMMEKELKRMLKEKGIDIDEISEKILNLEKEKNIHKYRLGEMLVNKAVESDLKEIKNKIVEISVTQSELSIEKNLYLEFSLENQLTIYLYTFITSLLTEIKEGDNWNKVWKSHVEFEQCKDEELVKKASIFATLMTNSVM